MTYKLVLRTSDKNGKAYGGFQWPTSGMVECPDFKKSASCGNGLHGILWPDGDWSDIKDYGGEEIWQVVKVLEADLIKFDGKVKFPRGEVIYSGNMAVAFNMVAKEFLAQIPTSYASVDANDPLTTDKKNAQIGSSGDSARIGSSGHYARIGSSGDSARIGSSGDSARIDATGKDAVIACAGSVLKFKAAEGSCISALWHDGNRTRFAVGYVGENIKADVWYTISETGEFVECK